MASLPLGVTVPIREDPVLKVLRQLESDPHAINLEDSTAVESAAVKNEDNLNNSSQGAESC